MIPEAVYRECVLEDGDSEDAHAIKNAEWIRVERITDERLKRSLMIELDEGESEAIVLALEKNAELVLMDDYDGREIARVSVSGWPEPSVFSLKPNSPVG